MCWWCDVQATFITVIRLQSVSVLNQPTVYLKLIQCYKLTQLYLSKNRQGNIGKVHWYSFRFYAAITFKKLPLVKFLLASKKKNPQLSEVIKMLLFQRTLLYCWWECKLV